MKKRLRKKKHKAFIWGVMVEVSQRNEWRAVLFAAAGMAARNAQGVRNAWRAAPIKIGGDLLERLPAWIVAPIKGRRLKYAVFAASCDQQENGAPLILFTVYAEEFPSVRETSWNSAPKELLA